MIRKATLFRFHKWIGIAVAAFLFVQAMSGLTLVFGPELARLLDPAGMISGPGTGDASPVTLVAAAEDRYPLYRVSRLVYPATADDTYIVHLVDERGRARYVSLDRHGASVLREGSVWRFPTIAALNIHYQWLAGRAGMALVTISGTALLLLALTGLAFWWPRKSFHKSLSVRWDVQPRVTLRQLHRTTGVVASPLLLFMAVTGLTIIIPTVLAQPGPDWRAATSLAVPIERALVIARSRYPEQAVRDIRVVSPVKINIFFRAPERNSRAVHRVAVDARNWRVNDVLEASNDRALWVVTYPLHTGEYFGLGGRLIIALAGLALAGLAAAGMVMWVQARGAKAKSAKARERKQAPSRVSSGA